MKKKLSFLMLVMFVTFSALQAQTWSQIGSDIDGEMAYDNSGSAISLSSDGTIIAIGAYGNTSNQGHVRVYQNINNTWTQIGDDIDGEAR